MEELLKEMDGKSVEVSYGTTAIVRGRVANVKDGVVQLRDDDDRITYVAIKTIAVLWEVREQQSRPGFVSGK
jgi:hypothetical protein